MRRLLISLFLLLPLAANAANADDRAATDIDRFVKRAMRDFPDVPAVGISIVRDGKPWLVRSYGLRDAERKIKADENTAFYIASSTKSYVGLLAAVMAQRGVVDLDAPITKYLPEVKFAEDIKSENVTLRALLSHRAGIKNDAIVSRTAFTGEHTPAMLTGMLSRSTAIEPKYQYDNLGYVAAGLVLERLTGKKWQDLLHDEIFKPLGMKNTSAYISRTSGLAVPYDVDANFQRAKITLLKRDETMHAAGGIATTPVDLAKWLAANIDRKGLPAAAFAEAQKEQVAVVRSNYQFKVSGYGFGWNLADYEGARMLYHMGGYEGWRAHVSFLPDARHGVAVVTNTSSFGAAVRDVIAAYIYDRLRDQSGLGLKYEAALAELKTSTEKGKARVRADRENRAKRAPSLVRDASAYAGVYEGDTGRMTIVRTADGLKASLGPLNAKLEPFTEPDTARVELIPGTGEVLRFVIEGDRATAVKHGDATLKRVQ